MGAGELVVIGAVICATVAVLHWLWFFVAPQHWRDRALELFVSAVNRFLSPAPQPHLHYRIMLPHTPPKNRQGIRVIGAEIHTIPSKTIPIPPVQQVQQRDIIKDFNKDLTDAQKAAARKLFTKGMSANDLAALLGGDRNWRLKQLREVRAQMEQEQREAEHVERLRRMPRDPELERMEPVPTT